MTGTISNAEIAEFVENNIGLFHDKQLEDLKKLTLVKVLEKKNPYLFRVKNLNVASDVVKYVLNAFLISREETNFGEFLERLAIFINKAIYDGKKSENTGIDLEFDKDEVHYIVSIKSGPKWGNSDQINRIYDNFDKLIIRLGEENPNVEVVAVNGCCYGRDTKPKKTAKIKINRQTVRTLDYYKYCGQKFWEFVSGNPNLYTEIVEPLGHKAKEKNEAFLEEYANIINRFTAEFLKDFCDSQTGAILWDEVIKITSGARN
jgi:hypothetical protein